MTINSWFVDPASGDDGSGDGSIGNPWATLAHAYANGSTGSPGTYYNLKSSAPDALTGTLATPAVGSVSATKWAVTRGYDSSEGDGGVGVIDGDGSYGTTLGDNHMLDGLEIRNSGSAPLVQQAWSDYYGFVRNCYLHGTSDNGIEKNSPSYELHVWGCRLEDIGTYGMSGVHRAWGNYFANGSTYDFTWAAYDCNLLWRNIVSIDGSSGGFYGGSGSGSSNHMWWNNSILSGGGSGHGMDTGYMPYSDHIKIWNNLIEGFSDTSGCGIEVGGDIKAFNIWGNAVYDCETEYDSPVSGEWNQLQDLDNETLSTSPFAKTGTNNYAGRRAYFYPVDTGNVLPDGSSVGGRPFHLGLPKGAVVHDVGGVGGSTLIVVENY